MSKLLIFDLFLSVGNLKWKLKWFFSRFFSQFFRPLANPRALSRPSRSTTLTSTHLPNSVSLPSLKSAGGGIQNGRGGGGDLRHREAINSKHFGLSFGLKNHFEFQLEIPYRADGKDGPQEMERN